MATYPRLITQTEMVDFLTMIATQMPAEQRGQVTQMIALIQSGAVNFLKDGILFETFTASSVEEMSIFLLRRSVSANMAMLEGHIDDARLNELNTALMDAAQSAIMSADGKFPITIDISGT